MRTAAAEQRATAALAIAQAADKAATFYATCAMLFFWSGVIIAVVLVVT